jgi:hypothetical protein
MIGIRECQRFWAGVTLLGAFFVLSSISFAQGLPTGWNDVRVITVKAGSVGEFEDLLGELNAARIEAGDSALSVFQVVHGPQNVYHIQTTIESLSEFEASGDPPMPPGQMAALFGRLVRTIETQERLLVRLTPELWLLPEQNAQLDSSGLWVMRRYTAMPGRVADFVEWYRDDYVPAVREAGAQAMFINPIAFGGNTRTYVEASPLIGGWSALDGPNPLAQSMGAEAAQRLISRGGALIETVEVLILRQRQDLMGAD